MCVELCRRWMMARGFSYCAYSRDAFVRAHPALCGRACDVTLRGYERWLARTGLSDELEAFASYLAPRLERGGSALVEEACGVVLPSSAAWEGPSKLSFR
jgi:hypothetical protein